LRAAADYSNGPPNGSSAVMADETDAIMAVRTMVTKSDLPIIELASQTEWRAWLEEHHGSSKGVWLKIAKKAAPATTVTHVEALEEALCHGWIDGQRDRYDEHFFLQRFTPRGPRSKWSQINRESAKRLIASGKMHAAGHAQVRAARADGRWDAAYEPQSTAAVPEDFRRALDQNQPAREFFETLTGVSRYAFLYRISDAKRPETRAKRIAQFVELLAEGKKLR
jgi:uncharacterized protein YdeI (YjbR/CyaY-like superfamily)